MTDTNDEDFDVADYERRLRKRRKQRAVTLIVLSILVLAGMIIFWK